MATNPFLQTLLSTYLARQAQGYLPSSAREAGESLREGAGAAYDAGMKATESYLAPGRALGSAARKGAQYLGEQAGEFYGGLTGQPPAPPPQTTHPGIQGLPPATEWQAGQFGNLPPATEWQMGTSGRDSQDAAPSTQLPPATEWQMGTGGRNDPNYAVALAALQQQYPSPNPKPPPFVGPLPEPGRLYGKAKRAADVEKNIGPGAREFAPGQFYKGPERVGGTARRDSFSNNAGSVNLPPTSSGRGTLSMMQANPEILPSNPRARAARQEEIAGHDVRMAQAEAAKKAYESGATGEQPVGKDAGWEAVLRYIAGQQSEGATPEDIANDPIVQALLGALSSRYDPSTILGPELPE